MQGATVRKTVKKTHVVKRVILSLTMAALSFAVHAAGLGKISVFSALGQPLKAEIEVYSTSDEAQSIQARLATADAFRQADIDYAPVLASLKFSSVKERDGRRYIQVTTDRPLNEPFVSMLVELNWAAGRLVREYTFLLDPPGLAEATTAAPASVAAPVVRPEVAVAGSAQATLPSAPATEVPHGSPVSPAKKSSALTPTPVKKADDAARKSYTVAAGDTLGKIAAQNLPAGVSLDQMLVALFRNNQQAFSGNNMNRLRAGKILMIPDGEAVNNIAVNEARKEVTAQAADFDAYRKKLAALAATEAVGQETTQQTSSGMISPKVKEAMPAGSGKDKLEVSRTEVAKGVNDGKLQGRIAVLEEDLVARDKAIKEANERAAELEKQLASMKKLVELKNQAGADLQQQAQAPKPVVASPAPAAPEVQKPAAPDAAASPPGTENTSAAPPVAVVKPVETPPPPMPKKKRMVPPPEPEPEPSFMEENMTLVLGGGGLLALVLGWFGFTAWKKRKAAAEAEEENAENDFSVHSGFSAPPSSASSAAPPPSEQQASRFSEGFSQAALAVDVLTEADTFLAFGRDAQAEEVLLAALETEPDRHAIYLKLLDIYAARKNRTAFESMAKRLHEQTGGTGSDWEKAAAMGALLDPENTLYKTVSAIAPATMASPVSTESFDATMVMQANPLATELPEPTAPAAPVTVDFDLDTEMHPTGAVAEKPDLTALDFDLDLGSADDSATTAPVIPVDADVASTPLDLPLGDDIDLPAAKMAGTDANSIDFDFDLTLDAASPDLDSIDLDLNAPGGAVSSAPTFDVTEGANAAENPEVDTKLELAAAYEEMGDREGAREHYQEVLAEGNAAQQEAARSKLASLG
jgi:pilus assembly protein FimV